MLIIYPQWISDLQEEIKRIIHKRANEHNVNMHLISDSKCVKQSILNIGSHLNFLYSNEFKQMSNENFNKCQEIMKEVKKKKSRKKNE